MFALWTLAIKDLRLLLRDRMSLFWILAFPLILALFFGSLFGGDSDDRSAMKVVVVDDSAGEGRAFVERLGESEGIEVDTTGSLREAQDLVRRGDRVAFVQIRAGFVDGGFGMFGRDPDDPPRLAIGVDPARTAERGVLQGLVTQALFRGMTEQMSDPARMLDQTTQARESLAEAAEMDPEQRASLTALMDALDSVSRSAALTTPSEPGSGGGSGGGAVSTAFSTDFTTGGLVESVDVAQDEAGQPRSAYDVTFPSSIVWGLMGCATAFATTMVRERRAGTLLRLRVSPLSRAHVIAGKGLACILAGLGASAVLLAFGVLALGVRVGDPLLLLLAMVCAAACFTGIMMVISVLGRTEAAVAGGAWVIMMPMAMIGGGMIPLIAMPRWLLAASNASPFKWAILAIEGAVWRDLTLAQMLLPLGILLALAVGLFALGVWVSKRQDP